MTPQPTSGLSQATKDFLYRFCLPAWTREGKPIVELRGEFSEIDAFFRNQQKSYDSLAETYNTVCTEFAEQKKSLEEARGIICAEFCGIGPDVEHHWKCKALSPSTP